MIRTLVASAIAALSIAPIAAAATSIAFTDKATFVAATGATDSIPSLTTLFASGSSITIDGFSISNPFGEQVFAGVWSALLPGNDIAVNGNENFNITFPGSVYSFGLDFHEPSGSPSTFTLSAFQGSTLVASSAFDPPEDAVTFLGLWTDAAFDRVEIRETTGINADEFLGHFYTGAAPIPEPASLLLFALGLPAVARLRRHAHSA